MNDGDGHDSVGIPAGLTQTEAGAGPPEASIGPYRLLERIGDGGMGEVWLAEQQRPVRRQVALKIIKAGLDTAQVVARFEAERQALALMDHPAIAKVFDAGSTELGRPYFAMEFVRGESLMAYCDRHRLTIRERLELFIQICEGVQHAHQKGIIHRDLKPSNILISVQGDKPAPRIIDFGVAKATSQPLTERTLYTSLGGFVGTLEYMSPEQAELGGVDVDTRADIYALGVVLYELLTGELPFDRRQFVTSGFDEIRRTIRELQPPKPSTRVTQLGDAADSASDRRRTAYGSLKTLLRGDLDWITMKALEKDRARRYPTAIDLATDIRRHLESLPVTAGPPSALYRTRKFIRRHRVGVGVGSALVALLTLFALAMTLQAGRIARERDRANREARNARQVADFLIDLFAVSDPSEARGNSLTAREILQKGAAKIDQRLEDQPDVRARLQATIGTVYTNLGLYRDAEPLLRRALETNRRVLGDDDAQTVTSAHQLANLLWYQDNLKEAERLYADVVARRERILGVDDPQTLRAKFDLGTLYWAQKRFDDAERITRETLERQRRVLGETHTQTQDSIHSLASIYYGQGKLPEAEALQVKVLELRRRVLGADHPETLLDVYNLATIHDRMERAETAEQLYKSAVADMARVLGKTHRWTCLAQRRLAALYARQKRFQESEALALAAHEGYAATFGANGDMTQAVVGQLTALYEAWGRPEEAARWRAQVRK
ncbi:MAG TPA: serine/threonine-protein kinase [Vicinamibacterales bacterium]|nr:serine/threonine-protein kinase [Vicinamibacterales bacterium]